MLPDREPYARALFDKALVYLFSYNVEAATNAENVGVAPDGLRLNVAAVPRVGRVYNVLGERMVGAFGFPAITGRVADGGDHALVRPDDVTISNVRATIVTDDGATISTFYRGTFALGQGGFRAFVSDKDRLGTRKRPAIAPIVVTPRYETPSEKYEWLMELQCVGFGRLLVVENEIRRITYDVYAMT